MNHRRTVTLCLLLGALGTPPASGAESEPARPADDQESQTAADASSSTPADDTAAGSKDDGTGDVFLPSEEISEDFAVSFPVDI